MKLKKTQLDRLKKVDVERIEDEIISFEEYLDQVSRNPFITRTVTQTMNDMIHTSGVDYKVVPGQPITSTYKFFTDKEKVGKNIVFGQKQAKGNLVEKISNASQGKEASKRLWILLGPPGSAKSLSMSGIKESLKRYSMSDAGRTYTLLLPTLDDRLDGKVIMREEINGKKVGYIPAPCFEQPLQAVPQSVRSEFAAIMNESVRNDELDAFLEKHPHYDGDFKVNITGEMSPAALYIINDFMCAAKLKDFVELMPYLKVKRMVFDASRKKGIGSYTPRDEKSQEAGSLVGNIDYSLLPKFGSESHPLVHDYKGELCVGANGFVEIHEILKLSEKFLHELLFATQDRFFKPEGQEPIPFNGVIIGHTNFHEYNMFQDNNSFEALRSRTTFIEMPFSTNFLEEERIYQSTYSNTSRKWSKEKKHTSHVAPHTLSALSLSAVMSRLKKSNKSSSISMLQKALVYASRSESGVDNNMAKTLMDEFKYVKPSEGTYGLDPRFIQNVFEAAEHKKIQEHTANLEQIKNEGGEQTVLSAIALENPCVTPLDAMLEMETMIKDVYANSNKLADLTGDIVPKAKQWVLEQIANDVYGAVLRDETVVSNTWRKYTDHVRAYARNAKVKAEFSNKEINPDEEFMSAVESYIGIADRDVFRKELSDAISSVGDEALLEDEPSYCNAIRKYVFENEFKNTENVKLLGWIKSGQSTSDSNAKEQDNLNQTVQYLIKEKGYCGKCARQALIVTANASSIME